MKIYFRHTVSRSALAAVLFNVLPLAQGAGFYISEVATPGSLGTAGVANPSNNYGTDSAWTNPAGMTGLESDQITGGVQLLVPKIEFDSSVAGKGGSDGGNAGDVVTIPALFYVKNLSDRSRFGFSITAPMGGGIDYGDDFVGRYGATRVSLQGVSISPSFAYKINDQLSLGVGISAIYTQFEQDVAINKGPLPDGKVKFKDLDDWGYQPFIGATWAFNDRALLGVVYRAEADVDLKGDVQFKNFAPASPMADTIKIGWNNPQLIDVGLRYQLNDNNRLFFKAGWEDWSEFSENQLAFEGGLLDPQLTIDRNWKDTWNAGAAFVRTQGEHLYGLGIAYDSSPVDDDDRTIDLPSDEQWKFSAVYGRTGGVVDYALGTSLIWLGDGKVDQSAQGVRFKGEFDTNYIMFIGGTIKYIF